VQNEAANLEDPCTKETKRKRNFLQDRMNGIGKLRVEGKRLQTTKFKLRTSCPLQETTATYDTDAELPHAETRRARRRADGRKHQTPGVTSQEMTCDIAL
jgi:hypothetical protein